VTSRSSPDNLRVLAFSDCRVQDIRALRKWVQSQPPFDLIVYAGDDVRRFRPRRALNYFEALAAHARFGLVAVIGNDDVPSTRRLIRGRKVHEVHSKPFRVGQFLFVGVDGAPISKDDVSPGYTLHSEQDIWRHLKQQVPKGFKGTVVLVSHAPPRGLLDDASRFGVRQIGSVSVRRFIDECRQVALVVCGHAHLCGGRKIQHSEVTILNIASHDNESAPLLTAVVELSRGRATVQAISELRSSIPIAAVPGISFSYARSLSRAGIRTLSSLASAEPERVGAAINWGPRKAAIFCERAAALVDGRPRLFRTPRLPPEPRIYLDIESDIQQSYCWLVGIGGDLSDDVEQFFAPSPHDERRMLEAFVAGLSNRTEPALLHFSGSDFDRRLLLRRLAFYRLPIPGVLESSIDSHKELFYSVCMPTAAFGLKEVAEAFGYSFRHRDLSGFDVGYQYQQAARNDQPVDRKLLEYNRDDVLAIRYILRAVAGLRLPTSKPFDIAAAARRIDHMLRRPRRSSQPIR
jgi:Icc-related predicted phosphoesterase